MCVEIISRTDITLLEKKKFTCDMWSFKLNRITSNC